jgi:flagellar basal-body rod protein FlgF
MDKIIYIAMAGAKLALDAQTLRANNLANSETVGFKADLSANHSVAIQGEGFQDRATVSGQGLGSDFRAGKFIPTGGQLDVAIADQGWFVVQAADGTEGLTRAGEFSLNVNGMLVNADGLQVIGSGGPINIPPATTIDIGDDGTISILPVASAGSPAGASEVIGQLKLVNPPVDQLSKGADGLFRYQGGTTAVDPTVQVISGGVEGSNVNAVQEMIGMIAVARLYEAQVNFLKAAEEQEGSAAQILQ